MVRKTPSPARAAAAARSTADAAAKMRNWLPRRDALRSGACGASTRGRLASPPGPPRESLVRGASFFDPGLGQLSLAGAGDLRDHVAVERLHRRRRSARRLVS